MKGDEYSSGELVYLDVLNGHPQESQIIQISLQVFIKLTEIVNIDMNTRPEIRRRKRFKIVINSIYNQLLKRKNIRHYGGIDKTAKEKFK